MDSPLVRRDKIHLLSCYVIAGIGLDAFDTLPRGARIVAGLFQGLAARASGFAIVPLAPLAPALQCVVYSFTYGLPGLTNIY